MFNSTILEVGIGLVFVYLLFSLACTACNELIAAIFASRAKFLWQGIQNLFEQDPRWAENAVAQASTVLLRKTEEARVAGIALATAQSKRNMTLAKMRSAEVQAAALLKAHQAASSALQSASTALAAAPATGAVAPTAGDIAVLTTQALKSAAAHADAATLLADARAADQAAAREVDEAVRRNGLAQDAHAEARKNTAKEIPERTRLAPLISAIIKQREGSKDAAKVLKKIEDDLGADLPYRIELNKATADQTALDTLKKTANAATAVVLQTATRVAAESNADLEEKRSALAGHPVNWAQKLYDHSLIQAMYQNPRKFWPGKTGPQPSYIPSPTFAVALIDLVVSAGKATKLETFDDIRSAVDRIPDGPTNHYLKESLTALIRDAEQGATSATNALKAVQDKIESWFDDTMDRVGGWYKRKTQYVVLGIAAVLAIALNVDTISIAHALAQNSTLRDSVVAMAQKAAAGPAPTTAPSSESADSPTTLADVKAANDRFEKSLRDIDQLGLPIGWKTLADLQEQRKGGSQQTLKDVQIAASLVGRAAISANEALAGANPLVKEPADIDALKKLAASEQAAAQQAIATTQPIAGEITDIEANKDGDAKAEQQLLAIKKVVIEAAEGAEAADEASNLAVKASSSVQKSAIAANGDALSYAAVRKAASDARANASSALAASTSAEHSWSVLNSSDENLATDPRVFPANASFSWVVTKLFGLLITALAASLGAPFWFDMLNKIVNIRAAGKSPDETPTPPKEIPTPHNPNAPAAAPAGGLSQVAGRG